MQLLENCYALMTTNHARRNHRRPNNFSISLFPLFLLKLGEAIERNTVFPQTRVVKRKIALLVLQTVASQATLILWTL